MSDPIKVVEQYQNSKTGDLSICEDGIFVNENFAAIVDGATSKSPKLWEGKTSGKVATELILQTLPLLEKDVKPEEAIQKINQSIVDWYIKENIYDFMKDNAVERPTASLIIYSKHVHQLWLVGDCQALIDESAVTNTKLVDYLFENVRAFYLETELMLGKTMEDLLEHDTGRDAVVPFIARQTVLQNLSIKNDFTYEVIDGFFRNNEIIKIVDIPINTKYLVLASDGYPYLKPTLQESEDGLRQVLAEDPLCFRKFKSTKGMKKGSISFDDRSYLKLDLSS